MAHCQEMLGWECQSIWTQIYRRPPSTSKHNEVWTYTIWDQIVILLSKKWVCQCLCLLEFSFDKLRDCNIGQHKNTKRGIWSLITKRSSYAWWGSNHGYVMNAFGAPWKTWFKSRTWVASRLVTIRADKPLTLANNHAFGHEKFLSYFPAIVT